MITLRTPGVPSGQPFPAVSPCRKLLLLVCILFLLPGCSNGKDSDSKNGQSFRLMFLKPNFGTRRCKGI